MFPVDRILVRINCAELLFAQSVLLDATNFYKFAGFFIS